MFIPTFDVEVSDKVVRALVRISTKHYTPQIFSKYKDVVGNIWTCDNVVRNTKLEQQCNDQANWWDLYLITKNVDSVCLSRGIFSNFSYIKEDCFNGTMLLETDYSQNVFITGKGSFTHKNELLWLEIVDEFDSNDRVPLIQKKFTVTKNDEKIYSKCVHCEFLSIDDIILFIKTKIIPNI